MTFTAHQAFDAFNNISQLIKMKVNFKHQFYVQKRLKVVFFKFIWYYILVATIEINKGFIIVYFEQKFSIYFDLHLFFDVQIVNKYFLNNSYSKLY